MCRNNPVFIKEPISTAKAYAVWITQLDELEQSTIMSDPDNHEVASRNSMNMGFKLFPHTGIHSYKSLR